MEDLSGRMRERTEEQRRTVGARGGGGEKEMWSRRSVTNQQNGESGGHAA